MPPGNGGGRGCLRRRRRSNVPRLHLRRSLRRYLPLVLSVRRGLLLVRVRAHPSRKLLLLGLVLPPWRGAHYHVGQVSVAPSITCRAANRWWDLLSLRRRRRLRMRLLRGPSPRLRPFLLVSPGALGHGRGRGKALPANGWLRLNGGPKILWLLSRRRPQGSDRPQG